MMYQTAPVGGSICLELIETCLPVHQEVMFTLLIFPTQAATFRTTICSRFYRFTCGIGLTKALSENCLHIHILLAQTRQEIIHIHLPLVVLTNLTEVFPAVVMVGDRTYTNSTNTAGSHIHTIAISNTGNDRAHNNMQPYISVFMWQRVS